MQLAISSVDSGRTCSYPCIAKKSACRIFNSVIHDLHFFINYLPLTVEGDLSRAYDLWRYFGDKPCAIASIMIYRFLGLFALILFIIFSALMAKESEFSEDSVYLWVSWGNDFSCPDHLPDILHSTMAD